MGWLVALAVAPGVFWLWYFRRRDRLRPEPRHLVGRVFASGGLAAAGATVVEEVVARFVALGGGGALPMDLTAAGIIGLIEEGAKFAALYVAIYHAAQFDEVLDGILYAVAASLGFATVENIAYVLEGGANVGIMRALLAVPGHAFFGAVMGFCVGLAKFSKRPLPWLGAALLLAAVSHAAYNAAVFAGSWVSLGVIPIVLLLWRVSLRFVRRAQAMDASRRPPL